MKFFNEIWLKVGEHEYIYLFEIEFEKKNIRFRNGGQYKICDMLIYTIFFSLINA